MLVLFLLGEEPSCCCLKCVTEGAVPEIVYKRSSHGYFGPLWAEVRDLTANTLR